MNVKKIIGVTCAFLIYAIGNTAGAAPISINPVNTYLLTNNDPAGNTIPILLADFSINAGDTIEFGLFGDWDNGPDADVFNTTIGIFSSSTTLLASSVLNRVTDAIDAGIDNITPNTYFGNLATDIPEDFLITNGLNIVVPTGAVYLFVSARDSLYYDNSDPDNNYAISIQAVPEPAAVWLFGIGLLGLLGLQRRRKQAV
ncbi:MAG: hypothetical protein BMS9Abin26_0762 [Gammaproteobacteria bacterium]|nr:MAG: hypothetical protein BMS9Abin26_0762 [Gammaproteobacteria bacterium]